MRDDNSVQRRLQTRIVAIGSKQMTLVQKKRAMTAQNNQKMWKVYWEILF